MKRILNLFFAVLIAASTALMPLAKVAAASTNLISNASVEKSDPASTTKPLDWLTDKWGTNTTTFTYQTSGQDGSHSLMVKTTKYTSGDAKWYFKPITVTAGHKYTFSEYYKSSIYTDLLVKYTDANGNDTYQWLVGAAKSANNWKKLTTNFTAPATAKTATVLHILDAVGNVQTDNFSLIDNTVVTPPPSGNIIPNNSLETANGSAPASWQTNKAKVNTTAFNYLSTGHTGGHSVQVRTTAYTSGDAYWSYPAQSVTAGKTYEFTDWYKSNVDSYIYGEITNQDGSQQWVYIGTAYANSNWTKFSAQFLMPANAAKAMIYQSLSAVGQVTTDDYSLAQYTPTGFSEGMVSVTFDDALRSVYVNGLPILDKYGVKTTQYMLTGVIDDPYYMTVAMQQAFKNDGHEIGSHSVTHPDLTTLTNDQLMYELTQSKSDLTSWMGAAPLNFASPHGSYNDSVIAAIKGVYRSHRSVDVGFNSKDNFNIYNIRVQNIVIDTTPAEVAAWVNQAKADHTWLVLVYHSVDPIDANVVDANWNTHPADLDAEMSQIKSSGISVKTVNQALDAILPQL